MRPRRLLVVLAALTVAAAGALVRPQAPARAAAGDQDLVNLVCSLPMDYIVRTFRGWSPDRGAEISYIAQEPNFVGSGLPHVGPWPYIQDVPMLWYGPGFIKAQGPISRPVTLADMAPTQAALLNFDGFHAPDGKPMTEALDPGVGADGYTPPKLIVNLVWDAGGMDVLEAHSNSWPYLKSLMDKGTFYSNATVGMNPTSTAQSHAIMGTGAFGNQNGIIGMHFRVGGQMVDPYEEGPAFLVRPTLADVYDRAINNEPKVAIVATADIHYGMMGHGAFYNGGDRDVGVTRSVVNPETLTDEGKEWNMPPRLAPYYRLAGYVNDDTVVEPIDSDVTKLDRRDGQLDGKWRDNDIEALDAGFETPAKIPYEERVLEAVITREKMGKDDVPDLMFTNFKQIDYVSHIWSMNSDEMDDSVVYQDAALKTLVDFLNREVGEGQWAMVLTADHGAMPDPAVSGGYQIANGQIEAAIEAKWDTDGDDVPIVDLTQPSNLYLNVDELEQNGGTLDDVSRLVQTLTQAQTAGGGVVPIAGHENDPVFQAVFPDEIMTHLPCYPEGKDTSSDV